MYLTIALLVVVVHTVYSTGARHLHGRLAHGRRAVAAMRRMTRLVFVGFGVELLTAKQP